MRSAELLRVISLRRQGRGLSFLNLSRKGIKTIPPEIECYISRE